ncbi:MAG: Hpt domain-containing protein [Deltaproteobacteria bacterium]|nr:Hpt domain-containing protein [Deltaproteobacteria bacterium]
MEGTVESEGINNPKEKVEIKVESYLKEIVPGYLEKRAENVLRLRGALEAGDFEVVQHLGHDMKGTGTGYGFQLITELGAGIEAAGKAKDREEGFLLVKELEGYLSNLELRYE